MAKKNIGGDCKKCTLIGWLYYGKFKSNIKKPYCVANIISSLNANKASGPNSIYYRISFLLQNEISDQLTNLFNLSFKTGGFPSVLKTAKVSPIFKKDSKLYYSNYHPISLLWDTEKILEKLCTGDYIPSLITKILSMTYSLNSDNNILHLTP